MPVDITERPISQRKVWTRAECEVLARTGILDGQRLELIEGELINKMGKSWPHTSMLALLLDWLKAIFGPHFVVQEQSINVAPEDNPTSEPEPDIVVLDREHTLLTENPGPEKIRLLVEVADTSRDLDLRSKPACMRGPAYLITGCWIFRAAA
jgi:hypothetical protein